MKWFLALLLGVALGVLGMSWFGGTAPFVVRPTAGAPDGQAPAMPPVAASPAITGPGPIPGAREAVAVTPSPTRPPAVTPPVSTTGELLLPVQGVAATALQDTFTQARSEQRSHDAIDIMAPAGTPVLAVADGSVEKLFTSERGGLTIYQFEPSGRFAYYYAHLQRYADGLAEGQAIHRGQVIGYVGSTGNASPQAPHLHFAIFVLGPERHWWQGTAINPYPVLIGRQALPR